MVARGANVDPEGEGEELDLERIKEMLGFVLRAPRRRPRLAAVTFLLVATLGTAISVSMPRTYSSQVKLLAQRDLVLPAIVDPGRAVPRDADNPTRNVPETIMQRDNLVALVKQADLVDRGDLTRSPLMRLKDRLFARMHDAPTEREKIRGWVGTLEKRLLVTNDENNVLISVDWPDPEMAYELVTLVQKNFLEARYDSEVAVITDALNVLETRGKTEGEQVDAALADLKKAQEAHPEGAVRASPPAAPAAAEVSVPVRASPPAAPAAAQLSVPAAARPAAASDPDLTSSLESVRRQIHDVESARDSRTAAIRQQLSQLELTLTPQHPTVLALQRQLDDLNKPSPELVSLKDRERQLMTQIASSAPESQAASEPSRAPSTSGPSPSSTKSSAAPAKDEVDGPTQLARTNLDAAIHRYQDTMGLIGKANDELDITRAAFKHRYTVVVPAELPTRPKKPVAMLVGVGSLVGGAFLALLVATLADVLTGRILETWQVRRRLKVDVLGEFDLPA